MTSDEARVSLIAEVRQLTWDMRQAHSNDPEQQLPRQQFDRLNAVILNLMVLSGHTSPRPKGGRT